MSVKFETVKAGDRLYDCHSERAGHTTMRRMGVWPVYVKEIDTENRRALVSWNGNPAEWKSASYFAGSNIRRCPPEWIADPWDGLKCSMCYRKKANGHVEYCEHPKAEAGRKK